MFSYPSVLTAVLDAQKSIETVLLSTHNICFGWEINKKYIHTLLSGGLLAYIVYYINPFLFILGTSIQVLWQTVKT